jgi:hypothetical protein
VCQAHPDDVIERWAEDEHRVGLKSIVRWVIARVQQRYVCDYLYACVRPTTGATWRLLLPSVRTERFAHGAVRAGAGGLCAGDGRR